MSVTVGKCRVCNEETTQKCSSCQTVYYCTREHQKQHWKVHKHDCSPIKISEDITLGRILVATRDLKYGTIIYTEKPLILGPSQITPPVCLGCHELLDKSKARDCASCGWPVCSDICEKSPNHKPECEWTVRRGEKVHIRDYGVVHPNYQAITVLRCLYQKSANPELWKKIVGLESHCEKRKMTVRWERDLQICNFTKKFFKLKEEFSDEEILRICGIVQVNAHEVPLSEPPHVAIYDRISMIEHNCRANCSKSFSSSGDVVLIAAVPINKGTHLSICYSDPLWGTETRRHHLAESKFFDCLCERCQDVTELGTMFSAIKCREKNCAGYLLPKSFIENDKPNENISQSEIPKSCSITQNGNDSNRFWYCTKCKGKVINSVIDDMLEHIGKDLSVMEKGSSDSCERFINHCSKYLHPSHYYMVDVGLALGQLIGQESEYGLASVSDDKLTLKSEVCRRLANLTEHLIPGDFRIRGTLLFELHAAIAERGRRSSLLNGPDVLIPYLLESKKILEESAFLLKHEPQELPEGKIGRQAVQNLGDLQTLLNKISEKLGETPL